MLNSEDSIYDRLTLTLFAVDEIVSEAPYVQDCIQYSVIPEFYLHPREGLRTSVQKQYSSGRIRVKHLLKNFEGDGTALMFAWLLALSLTHHPAQSDRRWSCRS